MKPLETGDPTSLGEGRYRLVGRLGQGGMGVVYLGRSRSGRAVAVKVVRPELSTEPGFRRRFADEVAAARRVGGFHTAPVVDADPEGEPAWLVTAFVPGPTLQAVLARVGSLPLDTLTVLAAGLAEALEAIHRAGVIHRDLKPANIIVAEDGPRVIDFGIARALDGTSLTQTGLQVGTPGFLAPEQLTGGGALTPAVDMFALGVVLTQAAGGAPFGDGPSAARHYKVVYEEPDLTAVPGELRAAIGACLSKDPAARPTPAAFLGTLTVRHRDGGSWLPDAATQLLPPPEPAVRPIVPDGPPDTAQDLAEPDAVPPVVAEPRTEQPRTEQPRTVTGPAARLSHAPAPAQVPQAVAEKPRRRRAVVVAVLVASLAAVGLYVWQPWTDSTKDNSKPDAATPTGSAAAPVPAPFPADPLLIRQDTAPGWPGTCHGVIARRDAATEKPVQLIAGGEGACDTLPQWSPDRRSFAFTRRTSEGTAVWTANADGSNARRITSIASGRVSWSPDGSRLAVLRMKDGVQQLFVVGVADGAARQLTSGGGQVEDPAWSPDGKSIAVCLQTEPGNWQIHVVDPADPNRAPQQVTRLPHPALDPVWSPDGTTFAYTAGTYGTGTQGDIRLVDADGSDDRDLVATSAHEMDPAWSADGTWVAFVRGPYEKPVIWAVRADKTGERPLTTGATTEGHPAWR
ncbi:protein kinase [Streptomyces sp. NBC_01214]|uniref:protein kinase domain-containing protein n=1 Tax=Streptomyces sp. NBC_01214 TaxID=2903777 RepID=UPI00225731D3|nr:protein kinase [Streptomyces sp. NBC_01214]MCX4807689.1 protein kinase [Streptomyces sp. NBC_01214]